VHYNAMNAPLSPIQQDGAYLFRLGERVRLWRATQMFSREALSEASGISVRYIAQLEAGKGNISILLLRKLARAMRMSVENLVADDARPPRSERIALVGLRGAGKSTLGMQLARVRRLPFVELDKEVEKEAGAKLGDIFAIYGQESFRRFERHALERVLMEYPCAVIAAGGSLVTNQQTYELLRQQCVCVWLKASAEEHMSRVMSQGDLRPFKGRSAVLPEIRQLLRDREPLYSRADSVVDTSGSSVKQSLQQLRRVLA
jgi:XRE family aerobic/anaerobic benzoate catabolism transcriptional regulator